MATDLLNLPEFMKCLGNAEKAAASTGESFMASMNRSITEMQVAKQRAREEKEEAGQAQDAGPEAGPGTDELLAMMNRGTNLLF